MVGNNAWQSHVKNLIEQDHLSLASIGYELTSPDTIDYNCVAWAAEEDDIWWWPDPFLESYWPYDVPREETLEALM
jgi:hypothetical protein